MSYNKRVLPMSNSTVIDLQIFLLGEFRIVIEGRTIPPRAWRLRRARQLVKLLALAPQHRLAPEVILESLWDNAAYDTARHSLHQVVHTARRALGSIYSSPERLIVWENEIIALCPDGGLWTDVEAFETAARQARRAQTIESYQTALALYTGELLPEDRYAEWTFTRREELRQLHLALRMELATRYERERGFSEARQLLEHVVAEDPLREEAHRALMRLYAREGKRPLALKQYHILRQQLVRELQVEPDAATRQLYETLQAASENLQHSSNLPLSLASFIGRAHDVALVNTLLHQARLVTLSGPGGSGKTRLALECARRAAEHENVSWVELAALAAPTLLPNAVAAAMNIQEQGTDHLEQRIVRALRDQPFLLVLDNCEHLLEAVASFVKTLLQRCPDLKILATSREALRVLGEQVWQLTPLAYPRELSDDTRETVSRFEAVQLFIERAQAVMPSFALTAENASAVVNICRRLEGLPLALELAAARVNALSVQQIESGLDDALQLLVMGERAQLPRHQTMRAAIEWSYALLTPIEAKLWARFAVFVGGFSLDAAQAVCAAPGDAGIREILAALVSKSLVQAQPWQNEMRYSILEVIRQYGLEKLNAAGEMELCRVKHFAFFNALAERGDRAILGVRQLEWLARFTVEMGNLRAALEWARGETATHDMLLNLSAVLWRFWYARGWLTEGETWLQEALAHAQIVNVSRAQALVGLGTLTWAHGDFVQAMRSCQAALEIAKQVNDVSSMAWAELILGIIAQTRGDFVQAAEWEKASLNHFDQSGEAFGKGMTCHMLGVLTQTRGDLTHARAWFDASLTTHRAQGNLWGAVLPLYALGTLAQAQGDWEPAKEYFDQSYALANAVGLQLGLGLNANNLGLLAMEANDLERAAQWLEESIRHFEKIGDYLGIARARRSQARLALQREDVANARSLALQSLESSARFGDQVSTAESLEALAVIAVAQNQFARAARWAGAAALLREQLGAPPFPIDHAREEKMLMQAREGMGDVEYGREWQYGATRSLEEIVRMALMT